MAKTQIYQQEEALSVYFRDMLAEPGKAKPAPAKETAPGPSIDSGNVQDTSLPEQPSKEATVDSSGPLKLLLCEIAGMKLALSVAELNNIVYWPEQGLTQLPDQADWQLGLFTDRHQQIAVVDIRPVLLAPDRQSPLKARYILLVDGRRRGIACDRIERIITVETESVNWRTSDGQRPWFSGVVADSMHNIIDLPALLSSLDAAEMA